MNPAEGGYGYSNEHQFERYNAKRQKSTIRAWTREGDHGLLKKVIAGKLKARTDKVLELAKSSLPQAFAISLETHQKELGKGHDEIDWDIALEFDILPLVRDSRLENQQRVRGIELLRRIYMEEDIYEDSRKMIHDALCTMARRRNVDMDVRVAASDAIISSLESKALEGKDPKRIVELYNIVKDRRFLGPQREAARDAIERIREVGEARHKHGEFVKGKKPPRGKCPVKGPLRRKH